MQGSQPSGVRWNRKAPSQLEGDALFLRYRAVLGIFILKISRFIGGSVKDWRYDTKQEEMIES
jgi:hypothetical protein